MLLPPATVSIPSCKSRLQRAYKNKRIAKYCKILFICVLFNFSSKYVFFRPVDTTKAKSINYLKPSGQYIYHQLNIKKFYILPTQCIYVFCVDLRTNSDYFPIQHWLVGFYNRDGVCLLRGTDWVFKLPWLHFVLKWLLAPLKQLLWHPQLDTPLPPPINDHVVPTVHTIYDIYFKYRKLTGLCSGRSVEIQWRSNDLFKCLSDFKTLINYANRIKCFSDPQCAIFVSSPDVPSVSSNLQVLYCNVATLTTANLFAKRFVTLF